MKVLDLFSGTGGFSRAFHERGHEVLRIDNDEQFLHVPWTSIEDVLAFRPREQYDVVVASPPCQAFSLAAISHHFRNGNEPISDFAKHSIKLVARTLELINNIKPKYWWMENPNGCMVNFVPDSIPRTQVTYCQYGESRMKLTNLWGNWPSSWNPRPRCKNGDPCHAAAPRGSPTGTQGIKGAKNRAIIPYELSLEICLAAEAELGLLIGSP